MKLLSIVIPTNGISEWCFPVLDSIFSQKVDPELYEVVVTDNGNNVNFSDGIMRYCKKHKNLIYKKTNAELFMNQLEAFRIATGEYIKMLNHRMLMREGSLQYLINFVENNLKEKPIAYFLNNARKPLENKRAINNYDEFLYELSYFISWSAGVGCWKSDLKKFTEDINYGLFPHVSFIMNGDVNRSYILDNKVLFDSIKTNHAKKGRYDVFNAFGIELVDIMRTQYEMKRISKMTYEHFLRENEEFLVDLYLDFVILRKPHSYDISSSKKSLNVYYKFSYIRNKAISKIPQKILGILYHSLKKIIRLKERY